MAAIGESIGFQGGKDKHSNRAFGAAIFDSGILGTDVAVTNETALPSVPF